MKVLRIPNSKEYEQRAHAGSVKPLCVISSAIGENFSGFHLQMMHNAFIQLKRVGLQPRCKYTIILFKHSAFASFLFILTCNRWQNPNAGKSGKVALYDTVITACF